jgi:NDP-sugar pyrophosphorylase family protein/mannose-6-phosphate isomerase-like protein (cupin superfamily)
MSNNFVYGNICDNKYINNKKIIVKPWGKEIWLALNDKYCYKRIEITAGFKTSYQLHNFKLETNYIISGQAEVWLENDNQIVEKFIMKEGDFFTVLPTRKHRVIAITDVILQEVSTPEVDDVIRLNDEFNRGDGKVDEEHLKPVVCILAAGLGTRLGNLAKDYHKALLPIKNKAILSHIIDKFDTNTDIIIAIGYYGEQIKEYVDLYHTNRNIKYITVDPYEGYGSGPAYSLECCRKELQRPFYFCVSDFYTNDNIQDFHLSTQNWIGGIKVDSSNVYSTIKINNGKVEELKNKSDEPYSHAFTGIFYMYTYKIFWEQFDKYVDNNKEVVDIFKNIKLFNFTLKNIDWIDLGTISLYENAISKLDSNNIYLHNTKNEYKYKNGDMFIKRIENENKLKKLINRVTFLKDYIPEIINSGTYFLKYKYFEGSTLYSLNDTDSYIKFLDWFSNIFFKRIIHTLSDNDSKVVYNSSLKFYKDKTLDRLNLFKFHNNFEVFDRIKYINGIEVDSINTYLDKINWDYITNIVPTELFHGDLQFDNIIFNGNEFKLIDWREDFGTNTQYGDIYYDLAKLYGGMELNYSKMKDINNYSYEVLNDSVKISQYVDPILTGPVRKYYEKLIVENGYDIKRIILLTALIYLNMAPLHTDNFDIFLFFKSKLLFKHIFG